jgi:hypothetical protein
MGCTCRCSTVYVLSVALLLVCGACGSGHGQTGEADASDADGGTDPSPELPVCTTLGYPPEEVDPVELVPLPASSRTPAPCGDSCRQVSFAEEGVFWGRPGYYDVWGDRLVVITFIGESDGGPKNRVLLVDLLTLEHLVVLETDAGDPENPTGIRSVDIHEDEIAVLMNTGSTEAVHRTEIRLYRFEDSTHLTGTRLAAKDFPAGSMGWISPLRFHGSRFTWLEANDEDGGHSIDVYVLDAETRELCRISAGEFIPGSDIWEDRVVYSERVPGSSTCAVRLYDASTRTLSTVASGSWTMFDARIWGDNVAWTDYRDDFDPPSYPDLFNADVYMYMLDAGHEIPVCTDSEHQPEPVTIWGDRIAWRDCKSHVAGSYVCMYELTETLDIYGYSISSRREYRLTDTPGFKEEPLLHGDQLYFVVTDLDEIFNIFEVAL